MRTKCPSIRYKTSNRILEYFNKLDPNPRWSFANLDKNKTTYITHSYHRYPAKFIPQIAEKIIRNYTSNRDVICDPFGGCGTTLVESKILGRKSIGFDINPVAKLITEAKTEAIEPKKLTKAFSSLINDIKTTSNSFTIGTKLHPRLSFWFDKVTQRKLLKIYTSINKIRDVKIKKFFLCGFSHILKNCSIWLMKSIKPTRDLDKKVEEPLKVFEKHIRLMIKKNEEFYNILKKNKRFNILTEMKIADAKNLPLKNCGVNLIVTSPPYVVSYEYADLHQLSLLWFSYIDDLTTFRKNFIGTYTNKNSNRFNIEQIKTNIASSTIETLLSINKSLADKVANYFIDMFFAFKEMYRILKKRGKVCIILGNTQLRGILIPTAEIAYEQMISIGFSPHRVIKRKVSNQMITPWRDVKTGQFTSLNNRDKKKVYEYEYLIIMKK